MVTIERAPDRITSSHRSLEAKRHPLNVRLLGVPCFQVGDVRVEFKSRKAEGLLIRLCLDPAGRVSRETAASLFWGDSSEHHARSSLRQTLLILRRTLEQAGFDGVASDKLNIALDLKRVRLDIDELGEQGANVSPQLLTEKNLSERLVEGGELLSDTFAVWLRVCRQRFHDRLRGSLEPALENPDENSERVEEAALALLNLDPTHEPACRAFMSSRAARGDTTSALRAYEDLWNLLEEEFDTHPSSATQDLVVDIKLGRLSTSIDERRLATRLLGFAEADAMEERHAYTADASADSVPKSDREYGQIASEPARTIVFVEDVLLVRKSEADRLTARVFRNALVAKLARFKNWTVQDGGHTAVQDTTSLAYRLTIGAAGNEKTLSFSLTLKNERTNAFVWGWNTPPARAMRDTLLDTVPDDIVLSIKACVTNEHLSPMWPGALDISTFDTDRSLRGESDDPLQFEESLRASDALRKVIEDQPRFAGAHASLARILDQRRTRFPGHFDTLLDLKEIRDIAQKAISLDPLDARGHLYAGWNAARLGDYGIALDRHRSALELGREEPATALSAALGLACLGCAPEAAEIARYYRDLGVLSPLRSWTKLIGVMTLSGNYDDAIWAYRRGADHGASADFWYIASLAMTDGIEEAIRRRHKLEARLRDRWVAHGNSSRTELARWAAGCYPIADAAVWETIRGACARAGLHIPAEQKRLLAEDE